MMNHIEIHSTKSLTIVHYFTAFSGHIYLLCIIYLSTIYGCMYLSIYLNMILNLDMLFQRIMHFENVKARCLHLGVEDAFQFLFFFFFTFQSTIICKTIIPNAFICIYTHRKTKQNKTKSKSFVLVLFSSIQVPILVFQNPHKYMYINKFYSSEAETYSSVLSKV